MHKITEFVLKRPVTTFLVVVSLIFFGFMSITNQKMELMSDIEMRLMNSDEYGYLTLYWNWYKVQEGYVLFITIDGFDYNDDDPDIDDPIDIPSDAYDKIYDAIEKSFGDIEVSDVDNEDGDDDVIIGARG